MKFIKTFRILILISLFSYYTNINAATGSVQFSNDAAYRIYNDNTSYQNVFDGNFSTWWDTGAASNVYVGIDTLSPTILTGVRIGSRLGETDRVAGGQIQASNATSGPWITLKTFPTYPPYYFARRFTDVSISTTTPYRYYRYLGAPSMNGNISELRFIGVPGASTVYKPAMPVITPAGGMYSSSKNVTITSSTTDALIYYTLDGTVPSVISGVPQGTTIQYTGSLNISNVGTTTIKAISYIDSISSEVSETANIVIGNKFKSGYDWYDTEGHLIDAHFGDIHYFNGKYYWYGSNLNEALPELRRVGVTIYSSDDLMSWKYEGMALYNPSIAIEQARVLYNDTNSTYVMWAGNTTTSGYPAIVATSSSPIGPFNIATTTLLVDGSQKVLHPFLFKDTDGTGYLIYDTGSNVINISKLNSDYLNTTGVNVISPFGTATNVNPVVFKRNNIYYLMASNLVSGFANTLTKYSTSTSMLGSWSPLISPFKDSLEQSSSTSFNSQVSDVLKIQGKNDAFIYMGDRYDNSNINAGSMYNSRYVWLPIDFSTSSSNMSISWNSAWGIDEIFPEPTDTTSPTINILSPVNGTTTSGVVTITSSSTDNIGVSSVIYKIDNDVLVVSTSSPFNVLFDTTLYLNGNHSITAIAADAAGNTATTSINIFIDNPTASGEVQFLNDSQYIYGNANGGDGGNYANVFDGNLNTYWASAYASTGYVGIDTGTSTEITAIDIAPRNGYTVRIYGMKLQGSATSSSESANWVDVFTVPSWYDSSLYFRQRQMNRININANGAKYRYYRLVSAPNMYGNIAEFRLIGKMDNYVRNYRPVRPKILPGGGYYDVPISVSIESETLNADIYYTTDGTVPNVIAGVPQGSTLKYSQPFVLPANGSVFNIKSVAVIGSRVSDVSDNARFNMKTSYTSGQFYYDTFSKYIESHSGDIRFFNGKWYWYGQIQNTNPPEFESVGISVYSSTDLMNWKDEGAAFYIGRDMYGAEYKLERAHVLYSSSTNKYVMWAHNAYDKIPNSNSMAFIATSDSPIGPFVIYNHSYNPQGLGLNDMTLFRDINGDSYLLNSTASDSNGHFYISKLTPDLLSVESSVNPSVFNGREAPTVIYRNGVYFLLTSGLSGWAPNENKYATATSMFGPWSNLVNPFTSDPSEDRLTAYTSQTAFIQKIPGRGDAYMYIGDRFDYSDAYNGSLYNSTHVILPVVFPTNGTMSISWDNEWDVDDYFPTVSGPDSANNLNVNLTSQNIQLSWNNREYDKHTVFLDRANDLSFTNQYRSYLVGENATSFVDSNASSSVEYFYRVRTVTAEGTSLSNPISSYWVADVTAPTVSSLYATSTATNTISISWNTNEDSSFELQYGLSDTYGNIISSSTLSSSKSITIDNLSASTTYHYRIINTDSSGNTSTTTDNLITTLRGPDTVSPLVNIISHTNNEVASGTLNIIATSTDDVSISSMRMYFDDIQIGNMSTSSMITASLDTTIYTNGNHKISAVAIDSSNNISTSTINIVLNNPVIYPILTNVNIYSSNSNNQYAKIGDYLSIDFTSNSSLIELPNVIIHGKTANVTNLGSNNYRAQYQLNSSDNEGLISFSIDFKSNLNVSGLTVSTTTNNSRVIFDKTIPNIINTNLPINPEYSSIFNYNYSTVNDSLSGLNTISWSKVSGIGTVTFSDINSTTTNISANKNDNYVIRLTVSDISGNINTKDFAFRWVPINGLSVVSINPNSTYINTSDSELSIDFNRNITLLDETKITFIDLSDNHNKNGNIYINNGNGNSSTLKIPYSGLVNNHDYKLIINSNALRDDDGNTNNYINYFFRTNSTTTTQLSVDKIDIIKNSAIADGTFENGWKWVFSLTIPDNENNVKFKFSDWVNNSNTISPVNNMRFYSTQSSNAFNSNNSILINNKSEYGVNGLNIISDLDLNRTGKQIQVYVDMLVPNGVVSGVYSTNYGISSN